MKKMEEDKTQLPELNVTAKWLDDLFNRITKITKIERICRSGMVSEEKELMIYDHEQQAQYQFRMLNCLIDEIEMLLPDIKRKLKDEDYKKIILKMNLIKIKSNKPVIEFFQNHITREDPVYSLNKDYYLMLKNLSIIRSNIVEALSPLLYGETDALNDRRNIR